MPSPDHPISFRSGFVSIIGRPNAGKSTLLNALVGAKLAIVTHRPQTTRNRIQGILNVPARNGNTPRPAGQIVLIDTPGVHKPESSLGKKMMQEVYQSLEGLDLVLLIVDASQRFGPGDQFVLDVVRRSCCQANADRTSPPMMRAEAKASRRGINPNPPAGGLASMPRTIPVFLLLNKIDLIEKRRLLPLIDDYRRRHDFAEIIPLSAARGDGLELLLDRVMARLPEGPRYFPEDQLSDQPERFLAAEIIREKVLVATGQEVPHSTAVIIDRYEELPRLTRIAATIYCEREGQKAILIGKRGQKMKKIGTAARLELERVAGARVYLELFVKVQPGWRDSPQFVERLDWRRQLEELGRSQDGEDS